MFYLVISSRKLWIIMTSIVTSLLISAYPKLRILKVFGYF